MPHSNIDPKTRKRARSLRTEMTKAESAMWNMLRDLKPYGARFRRETPIGPYIADFAWLSAHAVIEVDGDSHETAAGKQHDLNRDAFMKAHGYTVLRFDNAQVLDGPDHVFLTIEGVLRPFLKKPLDGSHDEPMGTELEKSEISKVLADGIESIVQMRLEMLKAKDFAEADKIRDDLLSKGILLKDSKDSTTGERVTTWELKR
jgi:very-short-patch-repair endonuclease